MIKVIRDCTNKLLLKVEGEIKINSSEIESYDSYVKGEEFKQIRQQIYKMLTGIVPSKCGQSYDIFSMGLEQGRNSALTDLAEYLAKEYN